MSESNLWKCPACGKVVDYGDSEPSDGRSLCEATDRRVRMERVTSTWPRRGPHFNVWYKEADEFLRRLKEQPLTWLKNGQLKYLNMLIDTRTNTFTVTDRDGARLDPDEVMEAVEAAGRTTKTTSSER